MKRDRSAFLIDWLTSGVRKPLVVRGARQVGKTWLIRDLAESQRKELIEINFEKRPELASLFSSNDPKEIILNISATMAKRIDPSKVILFLDEIQVAPQLLAKLRWFAEEMSELPVIAAGSLLDFSLAEHEFSMPVGRISYMYLEPFSFEEFLDACGQQELRTYLRSYEWSKPIPEAIHNKLFSLLREYLIVGGMPAAISVWKETREPQQVNQIHFDLLATYRDDFAKYRGRLSIDRLRDVLNTVPRQMGKKFIYRHANPEVSEQSLKQALNLLCMANVCHRVVATAANGLPLGAETKDRFFKVIMLDCGLCNAALGLSLSKLRELSDLTLINMGGMSEQLVGQLLRTLAPAYEPVHNYYWIRDKENSQAEIDYVIAHEDKVIPIEVKAGRIGTLKSLHQFMEEKGGSIAVRFNADQPSICPIPGKTRPDEYLLLSLPLYLVEQVHRLIKIAI